MQHGFYWYIEDGFNPTVVLVDEEGIQFPGNDDIFHVAAPGIGGSNALIGKFIGPIAPPTV